MQIKSIYSRSKVIVQKYGSNLKERIKNNEIRTATLNSLPFWIASIITH